MKTSLKLTNNSFGTSLNGIVMSILLLLVVGGIPASFIFSEPKIWGEIFENPGAAICTIILILCIVLAFLLSIISFIKEKYEFAKNTLGLKSMEFTKDGVFLTFNDVGLNCFYNYSELKQMEIKLHTVYVSDFNPSTYRSMLKFYGNNAAPFALKMTGNQNKVFISEIDIVITDATGLKNSITVSKIALFDTNMYKLLRKIKFYKPYIQSFSYTFKGPKDKKAEQILES